MDLLTVQGTWAVSISISDLDYPLIALQSAKPTWLAKSMFPILELP